MNDLDTTSGARTPSPDLADEVASAPEPLPVEWTWSPWRERPVRAAIALAFTVFAFALVSQLTASAVLAVLMALAIAGTLAPLLIPSRCRIDASGVALHGPFGWERRAWSDVKRARPGRDAFVVSPFSTPRRLDAFRALVLPIPDRDRDSVLAGVRTHCERHDLAPQVPAGSHGD